MCDCSPGVYGFLVVQVHHCCRARPECVGLSVRLHLLPLRSPQRLRSGHYALQRQRGYCSKQTCRLTIVKTLCTHQVTAFAAGINIFLDGYVPTENLRFRETSLVFKVAETANEEEVKRLRHYQVRVLHLSYSVSETYRSFKNSILLKSWFSLCIVLFFYKEGIHKSQATLLM